MSEKNKVVMGFVRENHFKDIKELPKEFFGLAVFREIRGESKFPVAVVPLEVWEKMEEVLKFYSRDKTYKYKEMETKHKDSLPGTPVFVAPILQDCGNKAKKLLALLEDEG